MLRILIAFFAGVAVTLCVLIPGKVQPGDLLDSAKRTQIADSNRASDKIERAGDLAVFYAAKAKDYVR